MRVVRRTSNRKAGYVIDWGGERFQNIGDLNTAGPPTHSPVVRGTSHRQGTGNADDSKAAFWQSQQSGRGGNIVGQGEPLVGQCEFGQRSVGVNGGALFTQPRSHRSP